VFEQTATQLAYEGSTAESGFRPELVASFRYVGYDFDPGTGRLVCRYALDEMPFEERITFAPAGSEVDGAAVDRAARLIFLLAGVSYYKAAAPPVIEVDAAGLTPAELALVHAFYRDGLGEFAYRNGLDISGLRIEAATRSPISPSPSSSSASASAARRSHRPLIPFGGGIDSIVTVEGVRAAAPESALFIVSSEGNRFEAIEVAALVTGLPIVRAQRRLDAKVLRSRELGFRNGHVPVTGVVSAIAVMAAVLDGRDAVVMSNEWSASSGNVERDGRMVNHQWSKTLEFEDLFRAALGEAMAAPVGYFSWLRPFSELWVARRFAALGDYHPVFRSCNRAFAIDPAQRLARWCGRCDKCCFIDLILAPFVGAADLRVLFDGHEPLDDNELSDQFRTLMGLSGDVKPFECVGDVDECRVAGLLAAGRADRAGSSMVQDLARDTARLVPGDIHDQAERLLQPLGPHRIPTRYAALDLLE
jgi:hypothetical protein